MITLAFPAPMLRTLRESLAHPDLESAAILSCVPIRQASGGWRLLVKDSHVAPPGAYRQRTATSVELDPSFCLPIERVAREGHLALVYVHTHPFDQDAHFSAHDDETETKTAAYLKKRGSALPHVSLLFGQGKLNARVLGERAAVRVIEVGDSVEVYSDPRESNVCVDRLDRQIRALGEEGQRRLSNLKLAIVGLGGTGSHVAQQVAYLGVEDLLLIDHDRIEPSNLNRVVGGVPGDIGQPKVEVAKRHVQGINPNARVVALAMDVTQEGVAAQVAEADLVFCCTDSHASRHVLNQLAYQYLIPIVDMGVAINVAENGTTRLDGHVKIVGPGQACLWCDHHLDPERVRVELMSEAQRAADPYVVGRQGVVQPAVISINGVVASVAVTMMLSIIAGAPAPARYVTYQGHRARMNNTLSAPAPDCPYCGRDAPIAWGDRVQLPRKAQ